MCSLKFMKKQKIWGTLSPFFEGGGILGRKVANRDFIRALLGRPTGPGGSDSPSGICFFDAFHFFAGTPDEARELGSILREEFPDLSAQCRLVVKTRHELPTALAQNDYHCFHLSDPFVLYSEMIRLRNRYSKRIFPVTAPTHSLSYKEFGAGLLQHLWSGVSGRDAVVVTSQCGREVVDGIYRMLRRNYGLDERLFPSPALPVIPLGVKPEYFPSPEERGGPGEENAGALRLETRKKFGLQGKTVFLTFARISYQSKMDLLPLLRAFKRAEEYGLAPGSYHFLLAGWEDEGDTFSKDIQGFCDNLGIGRTIRPRPDDAERKALYAAADVFISPSDNLQETFGLTMLEAAVSALPVIASDFDGYKDLVRHDATGILTPTLGPMETRDSHLKTAVVSAAEYHLRLAQQAVVDVPALGQAIARLGMNQDLRRKMGRAGREMALGYAWDRIIDRYLRLWDDLNAVPLSGQEEYRLRQSTHPDEIDYAEIFKGYFTNILGDPSLSGRKIRWSKSGEAIYRGKDFPVIYTLMEDSLPVEGLSKLLFAARKPQQTDALREISKKLQAEYGARFADGDLLMLWALKHDLLEFVPESGRGKS